MKKRAQITLNSVLTLIIAILGIVAFVFFAWKLYSHFVSQEEKNAQALLADIEGKINLLKDGETNNFVLRGFKSNPEKKWRLVSWNKNNLGGPDKCAFSNCLCICPLEGFSIMYKRTIYMDGTSELSQISPGVVAQAEICQKKGFCRNFDKEVFAVEFSASEVLKDAAKRLYPKVYEIETYYSPIIPQNFIELEISKKYGVIKVSKIVKSN